MDKLLEKSLLYDFYGELLTEHQKQVYGALICDDMSLSEIADEFGITRQAAHDLIKRCDKILNNYELKLKLVEKFQHIKAEVEEIEKISADSVVKELAVKILEEI